VNLVSLDTFVWVAKLQSFTLAAEHFGTTQQCASARVAALERELGVPLVRHELRHFNLTPQGIAALRQAEIIVKQVSEMKAYLAALQPDEQRADTVRNGDL